MQRSASSARQSSSAARSGHLIAFARPAPEGRRGSLAPFFLTAAAVLAVDQLTKVWARSALAPGESIPFIGPLVLTHVQNTGAAFGILPNQSLFLAIVAIVVSGVIILYGRSLRDRSPLLRVSLGLQLGGAIGNLVDRVLQGHVTDFFDLRNADGVNIWPVFNIADSSIVVGVAVLAVYLLMFDRPRPAARQVAAAIPAVAPYEVTGDLVAAITVSTNGSREPATTEPDAGSDVRSPAAPTGARNLSKAHGNPDSQGVRAGPPA